MKWDGYRLAIHVDGKGTRVITRGGLDWTHRFPAIAAEAKTLAASLILDGEAVVLDAQGRSDFSALQQALGGRGGKRSAGEAILYAFDLLYLDGHDLRAVSLHERRQMLETILDAKQGAIRLSETLQADGAALLQHACSLGLEGIIAKDDERPYRSGRTGDWIKIKCVQSDSFAVVGYEPSTAVPGAIGSLLLAARRGDDLMYVGSVGTGFKRAEARALKQQLDAIRTDKPQVNVKGKRLVFTEPNLVAEVEYRAWTFDRLLRHASFKGLRDAADNTAIYRLR